MLASFSSSNITGSPIGWLFSQLIRHQTFPLRPAIAQGWYLCSACVCQPKQQFLSFSQSAGTLSCLPLSLCTNRPSAVWGFFHGQHLQPRLPPAPSLPRAGAKTLTHSRQGLPCPFRFSCQAWWEGERGQGRTLAVTFRDVPERGRWG